MLVGRQASLLRFVQTFDASGDDVQIGKDQLEVDNLDVPVGIDGAFGVENLGIVEDSNDMGQRIDFSQPRQIEALGSTTLLDAGDIHVDHCCRCELLGLIVISQPGKSGIGYRGHSDVDLARYLIGVRGLAGSRQGIEQGGFADFGQTDDSYFHDTSLVDSGCFGQR